MSWGIVFFVCIGIAGIIILWTGQSMKMSGKIRAGWFIGQDIKMEKCRDIPGFIGETYPKIMSFGGFAVAASVILTLLEALRFPLAPLIQLVIMILIMILYLKFAHDMKKATERHLQ